MSFWKVNKPRIWKIVLAKTGLSSICICKYFLHSLLDDCSRAGASNVPTSQLRIMPVATPSLVSLINNPHIAQIINHKYDEAQNWEDIFKSKTIKTKWLSTLNGKHVDFISKFLSSKFHLRGIQTWILWCRPLWNTLKKWFIFWSKFPNSQINF